MIIAASLQSTSEGSRIAYALSGPAAHGVAAALVVAIGARIHLLWLEGAGALGLAYGLLDLIPRRRGNARSDGAVIVDTLRNEKRPTMDDAVSRWLVLFTDVKGTIGPERGRVLNAVPVLVGLPGKGLDALGVWRLAFAGWCWRAVCGDAWLELRDAALDAVHAATCTGAVEPDLTIVASRSLAATESPSGLEFLPVELRSIPVDTEKQAWAFQFGVALYDIERARGSAG